MMPRLALCTLMLVSVGLAFPSRADKVLGDITIPRKGGESPNVTPEAVFPHWKHRLYFKCTACHEGLFQMKAGADNITMDALRNGKYCAVCHNGKTAFQVGFEYCDVCHVAPNGRSGK